jgi:ferredoxin-thioredoxin reductase catalytic subunit
MERSREQIATSITKFAEKNGLHLHPGQDPHKWADLVLAKGGCPCVPERNTCPCAFALEDIKVLGRCRCGLFTNDDYLNDYNNLKNQVKDKKSKASNSQILNNLPELTGRAREIFLRKASVNGFSIEDSGDRITLRPRGIEYQAEITIEDNPGNGYSVVGASGKFAGFARGVKRKYFEDNVNRWLVESLQQAP